MQAQSLAEELDKQQIKEALQDPSQRSVEMKTTLIEAVAIDEANRSFTAKGKIEAFWKLSGDEVKRCQVELEANPGDIKQWIIQRLNQQSNIAWQRPLERWRISEERDRLSEEARWQCCYPGRYPTGVGVLMLAPTRNAAVVCH